MFLKISLGITVVFSIIIYVNMDAHVSPILLSLKNEASSIPSQKKEFLAMENKEESNIVTIPGKINTSVDVAVGNKEMTNLSTLENPPSSVTRTLDFPSYFVSVPTGASIIQVKNNVAISVSRNAEPMAEEPKIDPRAVLISPF